MKKGHVLINWVLDDEELLEPYEWDEEDDLEMVDEVHIIHIDKKTLFDFIYCRLKLKDISFLQNQTIFLFSDGHYSIAIEFDKDGHLIYRGTLLYQQSDQIASIAKSLPIKALEYDIYDYGSTKEYGLTRLERLKKQLLEESIDYLYEMDQEYLKRIYEECFDKKEDSIQTMYHRLKDKLETGYSFIHELLYSQLIKYKS